jgi:hypothetical protein
MPPLVGEVAEHLEHLGLHPHVEGRRRLAGDQQVRLGNHRDHDDHALPHAAGELVRVVAGSARRVPDAEPAEQLDAAAARPPAPGSPDHERLHDLLNGSSEADGHQAGETPMKVIRTVTSSTLETAWSPAVSAAGGQLLS